MDAKTQIFSVEMDQRRQMWTSSILSVATYKEYRTILHVIFENMYHDYPDLDRAALIEDITALIEDLHVN